VRERVVRFFRSSDGDETHAYEVLTGKGKDYEVIVGLRHDGGGIDPRWIDPRSPQRVFVMFLDDGRFERQTVFSQQ